MRERVRDELFYLLFSSPTDPPSDPAFSHAFSPLHPPMTLITNGKHRKQMMNPISRDMLGHTAINFM